MGRHAVQEDEEGGGGIGGGALVAAGMNNVAFGRRVGRDNEDGVRGGLKASAASEGMLLKALP
jgi:hypothetical protein